MSPRALRAAVLRAVARGRWQSGRLVILYAHDVGDQAHDLCVPTEMFAEQVRTLAEDGWQVTTLAEAIAAWRRPGRRVALCFDDGYEGVAACALPVLERYGFRATVFACTGRPGGVPDWAGVGEYVEAARNRGRVVRLMTLDRLAELHRRRWEIGAHTVHHPDLRRLSPAAVRAEVGESRRVLEEATGAPVRSFAYPYGSADRRVARLVAAERMTAAVGTRLGHARFASSRLLLPRLHLSPEVDPPTLRAMVSPLFPAYLAAADAARRLLGRPDPSDSGRP
jgi:peptidoglycan/xylan/chitin deacetylase (PgdA/CDA1 family)